MAEAAEKRIIKKYPNRRLYDTKESKYVTLSDIRELVLAGESFCVVEKKTDDDITRNILLQIIIEQEEDGEPIFSTDALQQIIGFYGNSVQGVASDFLNNSLTMFTEQQERFQNQVTEAMRANPFSSAIGDMTQRNMVMWREMQENFFKAAGVANKADDDD
ncbi:MAG: polyhydroxyalkanoate synthesis repressor PhaR [Gammaproteobacteria bacterium]|nr:polyhydroxyalkanoate synthesis repressor PhaR [Gammaproteobacteria bacterium]